MRAELVVLARHRAQTAYGAPFDGPATVQIGDTPLDIAAALATGARVAGGPYAASDPAAAGAHAVLPDLTKTGPLLSALLDA